MKYKVTTLLDAEHDIDNAYVWYELQQLGLGVSFYNSLNKSVIFISNNPFSSTEVYKDVRRFVIKKFPFGLYYKADDTKKEIQIIGVIHFKRSTNVLKKRV